MLNKYKKIKKKVSRKTENKANVIVFNKKAANLIVFKMLKNKKRNQKFKEVQIIFISLYINLSFQFVFFFIKSSKNKIII